MVALFSLSHPLPRALAYERARLTHWFHIVVMTCAELDRVVSNTAMKRCVVPRSFPHRVGALYVDMFIVSMHRMHRFVILAMSLSSLFDISHPAGC
jgi:hypothetical protein